MADEPLKQPEIYWEHVFDKDGVWLGVFAGHDGPCVFVNNECSCGRMSIGIIDG